MVKQEKKTKNNHSKASTHVPAKIDPLRKLKAKVAPQKPLTAASKEKLGHDLTFTQVYKKLLDGSWVIQKQPKETNKSKLWRNHHDYVVIKDTNE